MSFHIGSGIILKQGEKYILVQETRPFKAGLYNLPAGTPEMDEDIITCIEREAEEETGAKVYIKHFVGFYQIVLGDGNNALFFVFGGTVDDHATFHSEEHTVIEAVTYEDIVAYDAAGKLRSPVVLKAIDDYRSGQQLPLSVIQVWHLDKLSAIAVEKDH